MTDFQKTQFTSKASEKSFCNIMQTAMLTRRYFPILPQYLFVFLHNNLQIYLKTVRGKNMTFLKIHKDALLSWRLSIKILFWLFFMHFLFLSVLLVFFLLLGNKSSPPNTAYITCLSHLNCEEINIYKQQETRTYTDYFPQDIIWKMNYTAKQFL